MGAELRGRRAGGPVPCAAVRALPRGRRAGRALDVLEIDGASNRGHRRGADAPRQCPLRAGARAAQGLHHRRGPHADRAGLQRAPEDAGGAAGARRLRARDHGGAAPAGDDPRPAASASTSGRSRAPRSARPCRRILAEEKVPADAVEPDALRLLARAADGSLRDALSLLDTALGVRRGSRRRAHRGGAPRERRRRGRLGAGRRARRGARPRTAPADRGCRGGGLDLRPPLRGDDGGPAPGARWSRSPGPPDRTSPRTRRRGSTALGADGARGEADLLLLLRGLLDADTEMRRSPHPRVDLEIAVVRLCHRPRTAADRDGARAARAGGGAASAATAVPRAGRARSSRISSGARPSRLCPGRWRCRGLSSALPLRRPLPRGGSRTARPPPAVTRPPGRARGRAAERRRDAGRPSSPRSSGSGRRWDTFCPKEWWSGRRTGGSLSPCRTAARSRTTSSRRRRTGSSSSRPRRRLQPGLREVAFTAGGAGAGSALAGTHPVVQAAIGLVRGRDHPGP